MIPKRAIFYWDQGESNLPWTRRLAIDSFRALNPTWEVVLEKNNDYPGDIPQHRADYFRWKELYERGGVYFDTDIVFVRPFPDHLLQQDILITTDPVLRFHNIAVLGSSGDGNEFYEDLTNAAEDRVSCVTYNPNDYQVLGVCLMNRFFWREAGLAERPTGTYEGNIVENLRKRYPDYKIYNLPRAFVCPIQSHECDYIFRKPHPVVRKRMRAGKSKKLPMTLPEESIGVHWYGGHVLAPRMEKNLLDPKNEWDTRIGMFMLKHWRDLIESYGVQ